MADSIFEYGSAFVCADLYGLRVVSLVGRTINLSFVIRLVKILLPRLRVDIVLFETVLMVLVGMP